uniref:Uncharacterized protein n=1 Tax=Lygus hesperus TaxID=30085 RepID=A0A146L598_LYGHE
MTCESSTDSVLNSTTRVAAIDCAALTRLYQEEKTPGCSIPTFMNTIRTEINQKKAPGFVTSLCLDRLLIELQVNPVNEVIKKQAIAQHLQLDGNINEEALKSTQVYSKEGSPTNWFCKL